MFDMYADRARQAIDEAALNPSPGPPRSFGEAFDDAFTANRAYQQSFSKLRAQQAVMDDVLGKFQQATGEHLPNPYLFPEAPGDQAGPTKQTNFQRYMVQAQTRYEATRRDRPDLALDPFPTPQDIDTRAQDRMTQARIQYERQLERDDHGVADFFGAAAGSMTDVVNVAAVGLGLGSSAAMGVVRTAVAEGVVGAGSQAVVTGLNYQNRRQVDPAYGPEAAAYEIAAGGAGGAVLGGGLKLLGKGLAHILDTANRPALPRSMNDAINVVRSDVRDAETTPFPTDAGANAVHQDTVATVMDTLRRSDSEPITIPPEAAALATRQPDAGVSPDLGGPTPQPKPAARPPSLLEFLSKVGIRDEGGELKKMGVNDIYIFGDKGRLVRKGGVSLDKAREMAVEAGYLQDAGWNNPDVQSQTTVADLLNALDQDHRAYRAKDTGQRVYSWNDRQQAASLLDASSKERADEQISAFTAMAKEDGHDITDQVFMERAAAHYYEHGGTVDGAVERAAADIASEHPSDHTVMNETVPGWEHAFSGDGTRETGPSLQGEGGGNAGPAGTGTAPGARAPVRDVGQPRGETGPLADPTIGGIAATHLTEDAVRAAAKEPDAALAQVHAAEHLAEEAAAAGKPIMISMEDGQPARDLRDILRELDQEEAMAAEIGNCVIGGAMVE